MKQTYSLVTLITVFMTGIALTALSAEHGGERMHERGGMEEGHMRGDRMRGMMMREDAPMMDGMPMMRQMMGRMLQPQLVAAADGGVFVLVGNMLRQYLLGRNSVPEQVVS